MRLHRRSWLWLIVAPVVGAPAAARAQATVEVGPFVSAYAPVGTFGTPDFHGNPLPTKASDLRGVAWGALARLWFSPRVAIELQGAVTSSRFDGGEYTICGVPPSGCSLTPAKEARVVTLAAQVLYRPSPIGFPLWLGAGAGVVQHGGAAYANAGIGAPSRFAGTLGFGCDQPLGRRLTAALGVNAFLYALNVGDGFGGNIVRGFHADVLARVALTWRSRVG
jgi:hypothetical protein